LPKIIKNSEFIRICAVLNAVKRAKFKTKSKSIKINFHKIQIIALVKNIRSKPCYDSANLTASRRKIRPQQNKTPKRRGSGRLEIAPKCGNEKPPKRAELII